MTKKKGDPKVALNRVCQRYINNGDCDAYSPITRKGKGKWLI